MEQKWLLPTVSEVLACTEPNTATVHSEDGFVPDIGKTAIDNGYKRTSQKAGRERIRAEREWRGAIAALEEILLSTLNVDSPENGLVLTGPVPILSHPALFSSFQTGIFTAESFNTLALMPFHLSTERDEPKLPNQLCYHSLPLILGDPLAYEQFCLVFTNSFSLVMVLGEDMAGMPAFLFSFAPETINAVWGALQKRLLLTNYLDISAQLEDLVTKFSPPIPDYRIITQFTRLLLKHLPSEEQVSREEKEPKITLNSKSKILNSKSEDVELLQALTHEVRTPLTTIRTLTRLLLKRRELAADIIKRLEIIDQECTEQINRMELIFQAVELETSEVKQVPVNLTAISLAQVFQESIPHWQKQASRRNLTLDVVLPQKLPTVITNPAMLEQMLTGLIENFTRTIPSGGHIQVLVTPAGNQLKLQFHSEFHADQTYKSTLVDTGIKSLGQLLMFQPETGSLSLNLKVTKNLFQALGGKLIVRQRPQQGDILTIFLPLY